MAATQTEKQQNDLNSSEKAQPDQHLNLRNSLLQNGTEKNNVRGNSVVVAKSKVSGTKNLGLEMSQYRQDSVSGSCPASDQALNNAAGLETELNQATDINSYPPVSDDASAPDANTVHGYNFPFGNRSSYNPNEQHAPSPSGSSESNLLQNFGQFGPQGIRHGFPGSKQPMIGPRPPGSGGSGAFPQQQTRFMSGQSISQPTGPTPTLNQLLQSTNQIRYQNNYGHADHTPYGPSWQTQKPLSSYSPSSVSTSSTVYRTQNTVNTVSACYIYFLTTTTYMILPYNNKNNNSNKISLLHFLLHQHKFHQLRSSSFILSIIFNKYFNNKNLHTYPTLKNTNYMFKEKRKKNSRFSVCVCVCLCFRSKIFTIFQVLLFYIISCLTVHVKREFISVHYLWVCIYAIPLIKYKMSKLQENCLHKQIFSNTYA